MEKPRKTRYCKYYLICDRKEDCYAGEARYVPICIYYLPCAEKAFEDHEQTARNVEEKGKS